MVLQCPHQGAQILIRYSLSSPKTRSLQVLPTRVLTGLSLLSGTGADLSNFEASPLSTLATKVLIPSAVTGSLERYLFLASLRRRILGVSSTLTPRYSANLRKWSALATLSTTVQSLPDSSEEAASAKAPCSSSPFPLENRMMASFFSLKMELTAPSPKVTTSVEQARVTNNKIVHTCIFIIIINMDQYGIIYT